MKAAAGGAAPDGHRKNQPEQRGFQPHPGDHRRAGIRARHQDSLGARAGHHAGRQPEHHPQRPQQAQCPRHPRGSPRQRVFPQERRRRCLQQPAAADLPRGAVESRNVHRVSHGRRAAGRGPGGATGRAGRHRKHEEGPRAFAASSRRPEEVRRVRHGFPSGDRQGVRQQHHLSLDRNAQGRSTRCG